MLMRNEIIDFIYDNIKIYLYRDFLKNNTCSKPEARLAIISWPNGNYVALVLFSANKFQVKQKKA